MIDELREAATCLDEASTKLKQAVEEALVDERPEFGETIGMFQIAQRILCG